MAEQAFRDSPDGKRLFYHSGFWSRPYIVPDGKTEQRLFTKQLWITRFIGCMILGQSFLFAIIPEVFKIPTWFLSYIFTLMSITWLVGHFVFRTDLAKLNRTESRVPLRAYFASVANGHRTGALAIRLIGSLLFVAGGILTLLTGGNPAIGWCLIGFLGAAAVVWGYALFIKTTEARGVWPR